MARVSGGTMKREKTNRMTRNSNSSTKKVALGTRKLLFSSAASILVMTRPSPSSSLRSRPDLLRAGDEHEQRHEGQVDEVHALTEADDQEHRGVQPPGRLRLAGHTLDHRGADQAVADRRAQRAGADGDAAADHGQAEQHRVGALSRCLRQNLNAHVSPRSFPMAPHGAGA